MINYTTKQKEELDLELDGFETFNYLKYKKNNTLSIYTDNNINWIIRNIHRQSI